MPRAVILTSHIVDYQAVRAHLTGLEEETHPQGTVYELGQFSENEQTWEVAIAEIDNNNASAASETERAISHFQPNVILLVSAATGIKDVSLGDIVIATKIYGYESGRAEQEFSPRPVVPEPSYQLRERAKAERKKENWMNRLSVKTTTSRPSVILAPIASGAKEVADSQAVLLKFLRAQYGDAVAVDNLGFGFLEAAKTNENVLALTIYGISNLINDDIENIQSDDRVISLKNASAFMFELLAKYKIADKSSNKQIQGVELYAMTPEGLFVEIGQRADAAAGNESNKIIDERDKRVEYGRTLINQGKFSQAVSYLEDLKAELWHHAGKILKYLLLSKLAMAKLGLDEIESAAMLLVEALQYNSEDDKAISLAAMGHVFQKDYVNAEKLICKSLEKNPANAMAHSLRIRMVPITEPIESVLERIPPSYHKDPDVLVALGEAALNRRLYCKAKDWLQAALIDQSDASMKSVKAALALAFIEPILEQYPLIASGQLQDEQRSSLERAVSLFTEVLGGDFVNPNDLSYLDFTTLANRGGALRLLGQYDEAIRDIDIALQKEPENPNLIKQRALLAHEKGNDKEAFKYLQPILSSPKIPEASLLAASSLITLGRKNEAEEILNKFLQTASPADLKLEARRIKFDLFLERDDRQNAEVILKQIINEDPESIFTYIQRIRWQRHIDKEENVPSLVEEAKAALSAKSFSLAQLIIADALFSWEYHRDAAEIYEQFVDKSLNSSLSRRLLQSYYLSGNYKDALNLCKPLLDKYGPLEMVSEMAACIYESIGDMDGVKNICQNYLNVFPNDIVIQLRLALAHYATGEYDKLDEFLDSESNTEGLDLIHLKRIAQLYKFRDKVDKFLELIYEIRHRFYNDGQVHAFYQISYLETLRPIQDFEVVQDGCGVLLRNQVGQEQWYILEDRPDSVFAQYELNASQPLYQDLIGKKIGDEIVQAEDNFGRNALKILAVTDKYCAAGKQSFPILENQTGIKGFRSVAVSMDGDEISPDWIQNFIEGLQNRQDNFNIIKTEYIVGKIPFGTFASLIDKNPIELWQILISGDEPFIHSWSNIQNEGLEDTSINLQKGGLVVIDPISLITLHSLGIADDIVGVLGSFGIAQSTIDLFQAAVEMTQGYQSKGFSTFGVEKGQGIFHEISSDQVSQQREFFENIITWTRNKCSVLPCHRALDLNQDEQKKLRDCVGSAFSDTVTIAGEPGRILYSDDQWLRWYAHADSGVPGVWTQSVLNYCFLQHTSNETLYRKAVLGLVARGYTYTIVDAETLMEAVRSTGLQVQPIYKLALRALANEHIRQEYTVSVAAVFLYQLYLEVVMTDSQLIDPRDELVFELLKIMTLKRSSTSFIYNLKQAIHKRFQLIPLQERQVLTTINAWGASQPIIT